MDAYYEMEHWGIQIYAAIDTYSRAIIWIYVGITGRTAMSVLAQYIATLSKTNIMPQYVRSDRGGETTMAADAHYQLSKKIRSESSARLSESSGPYHESFGPAAEYLQPPPLPFSFEDCFKFGTSKANQRIESWWNQMCRSALGRWIQMFKNFSKAGVYDPASPLDRIAFFAIYIPIIQ